MPSPTEPEMVFHEFVFVLGRIAESTISITDTDDPTIQEKLSILLVEKLRLRKVDVEEVLKKNYQNTDLDIASDSSYEEESEEEYVAIDDPQKLLSEFLQRRMEMEQGFMIDYNMVLKDLETDLARIPERPSF